MSTPLLATQDLSIHFGGLKAVDNVTLDVPRGGITSIIGPNGAGKSTLFNLISGGLAPTTGKVYFNGDDVTRTSTQALLKLGLSRSFQITNLFPGSTVYENLRLAVQINEPVHLGFLPSRLSVHARREVEDLMAQFQLEEIAGEMAGHLSHGEQRRLEIAVSLASHPKLLMLDEPTQGMSHSDTQEAAALIRALAAPGGDQERGDLTIILVEHDIDLVMDLSDKVVVLTQGQVLAEGTPEEVRSDSRVQDAYLGGK